MGFNTLIKRCDLKVRDIDFNLSINNIYNALLINFIINNSNDLYDQKHFHINGILDKISHGWGQLEELKTKFQILLKYALDKQVNKRSVVLRLATINDFTRNFNSVEIEDNRSIYWVWKIIFQDKKEAIECIIINRK